jgi:hypothetical protein
MLLELASSKEELAFQEKFPAAYRYAPFPEDNTDHTVVIQHRNCCPEAFTDTLLSNVSVKKVIGKQFIIIFFFSILVSTRIFYQEYYREADTLSNKFRGVGRAGIGRI